MTAEQDRCPSRIAHEDGAVRQCMVRHVVPNPDLHAAGDAHWTNDDDRVLVGLASAEFDAAAGEVHERLSAEEEPHHAAARERTEEEAAAVVGHLRRADAMTSYADRRAR